uniref:Anion exchange protein n=1 Tax=Panagrolaimus superbus TaxID=310955 RepID=A0A914YZ22_9BILA
MDDEKEIEYTEEPNRNVFASHQNLTSLAQNSGSSPSFGHGSTKFQVEPVKLPSDLNNDESGRPRVKFKMSASIESLEKIAPAKSPVLKSVLKPFQPHTYHAGDGLKKLLETNIDDIPFRSLENALGKRNSKTMFPEHAVVQLYHFDAEHEGGMWHEAARFIKYEQTVEGIDTMWSKPHVPFLTFTSVMALRKILDSDQAMCALDVEGENFGEICHYTAVELENLGAMNSEDSNSLVAFMTFRRDHAKNNQPSYNWIRKLTTTGRNNASMIFHRDPPTRCVSTSAIDMPNKLRNEFYCRAYGSFGHNADDQSMKTPMDTESSLESASSLANTSFKIPTITFQNDSQTLLDVPKPPVPSSSAHSLHSMKSNFSALSSQWDGHPLPEGSECVQVLVGKTGIFDETKIPIRFIILIVGPVEANNLFLEMGRVFASLVTNKDFLSSLYSLKDKKEMVRSFDSIMNSMTMLPPGKVDSPEILSFEAYQKVIQRNQLRQRKRSKKPSFRKIPEENEPYDSGSNETILEASKKYNSKKKNQLFSNFVTDFYNLKQRYISDYRDIKEGKMLAFITIIALYLSLLPPTITFAKILEEFTGGGMGVTECLIATCLIGIIWAVFSAQPLLVQSVTGPVMIFEGSFYKLSQLADLDYMEVRVYAGVTVAILCFLLVAFNGTRLLKYITGFTEEIFTCLIAIIYIMETGHYIYHEYEINPTKGFHFYRNFSNPCLDAVLDHGDEITAETAFECDLPRPNAGLMAAFVVLISFGIAMVLYYLRFSVFLGRCVRNFLSDFNILITLIVTVALIYFMVPKGILRTVNIPLVLRWTNRNARRHDMIIVPNFDPWYIAKYAFAGFFGGLMIFVLLTLETSMCYILLQQKARKLEKPGGLNWDLMITGLGVFISSLLGLPWMCVAGVQTISHCKGLSYMKKTAPGENPKVSWVVENRITTLCVALLFGATTLFGKYLNYIPVACLFGVFLYSGMTSMMETSLFAGLLNVMHFGKHFRHTNSDMNVTANRIRFYRFLQVISLITIYVIKQIKSIAIMFPFVLFLLIVGRQFLLPFIYSEEELNALDPEEEEEDPSVDSVSSSSDIERNVVTVL